MIRSFETRYVGPASHAQAKFGPRLNLMTGDNGLGKSFVLETLWWALTRRWRSEVALPKRRREDEALIEVTFDGKAKVAKTTGRFDTRTQRWSATRGHPPKPGLVIYATADGGFAVWDPLRHHSSSRYVSEYLEVPFQSSLVFDQAALWNGLQDRESGAVLCRGLIEDWVAWQRDDDDRFDVLTEVLKVLSRGSETLRPGRPQRVRVGDARSFPTLRLPYGTEAIVHVSAGVQRIISLAYLLVWSWHEHVEAADLTGEATTTSVIFLFDEIEAHLHPRWQRRLLPSLLEVVRALSGVRGVQLIGATHSPLLCSSVETIVGDDTDRLFTFDLVQTKPRSVDVELKRVPWEPIGEVDAWLRSDLFDLTSTRSIEAEELLRQAAEMARRKHPDQAAVAEITTRLHDALPATDPFWARWELVTSRAS